jgi:hypothetical protein
MTDSRDTVDIPRTPAEEIEEEKVDRLEAELSALEPGVQVIISRLQPSWCKGKLEKITVPDEGIDVNYLIRTWGGKLLSLKVLGKGNRILGSHSIELYTFEPRIYGKPLRQPTHIDGSVDEDTPTNAPIVPTSAPQQDMTALYAKMFELADERNKAEIDGLKQMLITFMTQSTQQPPPQQASALGGISDLVKTANAINQLKEAFHTEPVLSGASPEDAFPGQVMDVLKMFLDNKQSEPAKLTGPVQAQLQQTAQQPPATRKVTPIHGTDPIAQITAMDPTRAADTLITALGRMPQQKKAATVTAFWKRFEEYQQELATAAGENPEEYEEYEDEEDDKGVQEN